MYLCRLFHGDAADVALDQRLLGEGDLRIGRDPSLDWVIADPDATLSRHHCTLAVAGGRLTLIDESSNGVHRATGERLPRRVPVELAPGDDLRLGAFRLTVDRPDALTVPAVRNADAGLVEIFCAAAGLDSSAMSGEDPAELMRRAGVIYRETVDGLAKLLADRARLKRDQGLDRTTIGAIDNNPFKWLPGRRLAEDLLMGSPNGFLGDGAAVRASFADLGRHLAAATEAGAGAVAAAVAQFDPETIEGEAAARGFSLRGRAAQCWEIVRERHAALDGTAAALLRDGYDRASAAGDGFV